METFNLEAFANKDNIYLIGSYIDKKKKILEAWKNTGLDDHIFICSSGTTNTNKLKTYALSKEAVLTNARAVNSFLGAKKEDIWMASLPFYHIGGLSIYARAFLLGNRPLIPSGKWSNDFFKQDFNYASVVPAQLFDLVQAKLRPSKSLKGLFVGGDYLSKELCQRALDLNWPLIRTYGMTEVCSQLASSFVKESSEDWLDILPIHNVNDDGVRSPCLYSAKIIIDNNEVTIEKSDDFFKPDDRYILNESLTKIKVFGRRDSKFNYLGKLFEFRDIQERAQKIFLDIGVFNEAAIILAKCERFGLKPTVLLENHDYYQLIEQELEKDDILSYFKIDIRPVAKISKTQLGKVVI